MKAIEHLRVAVSFYCTFWGIGYFSSVYLTLTCLHFMKVCSHVKLCWFVSLVGSLGSVHPPITIRLNLWKVISPVLFELPSSGFCLDRDPVGILLMNLFGHRWHLLRFALAEGLLTYIGMSEVLLIILPIRFCLFIILRSTHFNKWIMDLFLAFFLALFFWYPSPFVVDTYFWAPLWEQGVWAHWETSILFLWIEKSLELPNDWGTLWCLSSILRMLLCIVSHEC